MADKKTVRDIEVSGKRVLVRVDFNVPFKPGTDEISNANRIVASLPTIRYLLGRGASVVLCSHLGRPRGRSIPELSLRPIRGRLAQYLDMRISFSESTNFRRIQEDVSRITPGEVILLENMRFHPGEETNAPEFSKELSDLAEFYVNDAFGASHRAHASIQGITGFLPSVAGLLLEEEIRSLEKVLLDPLRPFVAVLGGAKVSDKINVVNNLSLTADKILIGGGMAATFLNSTGIFVGSSTVEEKFLEKAKKLLNNSPNTNVEIVLPVDVVVSAEFDSQSPYRTCPVSEIGEREMLLDIGPQTRDIYAKVLSDSSTVLWNGPMGVFEWDHYSEGTRLIANSIARDGIVSVIGGGSTVDAVSKFGLEARMTHISTGGGASLEFMEGKDLPGIVSLLDADESYEKGVSG
ncbi:MAG: phosphoglycerate kinase [SAR202 cluster bacterium]|nr:phosphoglycerate kinase [SAR202 cluster bacterium]